MKKALRLIPTIILVAGIAAFALPEDSVYICKGPYSERYHLKKDCRGLNNCSTETSKVSLAEARKLKRTLCGFED